MSQKLVDLFNEKNAMTANGKFDEANQRFYAEKTKTFDFTGNTTNGKADHTRAMQDFISTIAKVNQVKLLHTAIGNDVTFAEFIFDFDMKDGSHIYWHEIIASKWQDGLIVEERYFKA
jgi:hypothetical protein